MSDAIRFKFKFINDAGNEESLFSKKGTFDLDALTLDGKAIPVFAVERSLRRHNRLIIVVNTEERDITLAMVITSGKIDRLHRLLNEVSSQRRIEARHEHLASQGKAEQLRVATCMHCNASLDLTGFPVTPQLYCEYCDTVQTLVGEPPADEAKFALCDETRLYSQPRAFTIFYFYFLGVLYGWRYRKTFMCNAAMKPHAWKMLLLNLPFIIGVPVAVTQLVRVYRGGEVGSVSFKGLAKANSLSIRRKADAAVDGYEDLLERLPLAAGVHYNIGLTQLLAGRVDPAAVAFELALKDCANYTPAAQLLTECYNRLGMQDQVKLLEAQWSRDESRVAEALAGSTGGASV